MLDHADVAESYDAGMEVSTWIASARAKAKMTQEELADRLGLTKGTVSHWENGRHPPSTDQLLAIEAITGQRWRAQDGLQPVVVVGTARLGPDGYYEEISSMLGAGDGHLNIASSDPQAYALRLRGDSMFPAIRNGWFAVVEPNARVAEGEYILVKLKDGRRMVKELLYRRYGSIELMSVNNQERLSIDVSDLDENHGLQSVGAIVSPSHWIPE